MEHLSPERWAQLEAILGQAMKLPPHERSTFVHQACTEDPALQADVEALLVADVEAGSFLEEAAHEYVATLLSELWYEETGSKTEPPGTRIGPYQIVREIGRGGMGQVYLADRADGQFAQQVALKLVKRGMDSKAVLRRFLAERQILAQLRHANIAGLLDGGVSDEGQSYFVMEYVDGQPITDYCDHHRLTLEERLRLFVHVCEAVQYAHQNLVVHRDLKPSNILVQHDGQVKLLDFGIAKVLSEQDGREQTALTQPGMLVLTPEYAAPEQVRGTAVTTATDTYALGVLLYELLTAHRPYWISGRGQAALERVICQTEPERPSIVVGRIDERAHGAPTTPETVSQARNTPIERLQRQLKGDLDTIVLKALRKEPERRYPSAAQFLEDIQRHRAGLPVLAQRDTLGYRAKKFARRHRWGVSMAAILVMLITGFAVTMALQQAQTARERDRAQNEAEKLTEVKDFLVGLFEVSDPWRQKKGGDTTAQELLDRGAEQIEALSEAPNVQAEMLLVLGMVHRRLGLYDEAHPLLEHSLALRQALHGEQHLDVASSLFELGELLEKKGDYSKADTLYRRSLAIRQALLGPEDRKVANTMNNLAVVLAYLGDYDQSEHLQHQALAMQQKMFGDQHEDVVVSLNNLALLMSDMQNHDEALRLHQEALTLKRKLWGNQHPSVATTLNNLGSVLRSRGDLEEAEKMHREALAMRRHLLGDDHPELAYSLNNLAAVLYDKQNYAASETALLEALAIRRRALGSDHEDIANTLNNLARLLDAMGSYEKAERLFREALTMRQKTLGNQHPYVAYTLFGLGQMLNDQNRHREAEPLLRQALQIRLDAHGDAAGTTVEVKFALGSCLAALARYEEADSLLLESLTFYQNKQLDDSIAQVRQALVDLYTAWGKPEKAAAYQSAGASPTR